MSEKDAFAERGRASEEEYFRRRDRELLERLQRSSRDEGERRALGARTGLADEEALRDLQALGFTTDTLALLPLMPLVQVAWADFGVTEAERDAVLRIAHDRGIADDSPAGRQLREWLTTAPAAEVFDGATRLIRAVLDGPAHRIEGMTAGELVACCERIAESSGGVFGIIGRVSADERARLDAIARALTGRSR